MSQWISKCNFPILYLSFVLLWLYYAVYTGVLLAWIGFFFLLFRLLLLSKGRERTITFGILLVFGLWFSYQTFHSQKMAKMEHAEISHLMILPDTIKVNGDSLTFRGKANGQLYTVYYQLQSQQEKEGFQNLDQLTTLEVEGQLSLPEEQRNFNGFNYAAYLKTQGIYRTFKIARIKAAHLATSWDLFDQLSSLRRKAILWIKKQFPAPMNNYMTGLLLGYLDSDFEEMNDLYSSLGIIHLFALSGMQVGFFMDAFRKFLLRLGLTMEQVKWLTYPFALIYAGITGFSVSVVRSLIQRLLGQHGVKKLDNLAVTFLLLCFLMPQFLLTAGGVLSCAYAFILTMTSFEDYQGIRRFLLENLVISLGILPLLSFYFGEFQPFSILLTFIFSILFDLIFLPGLSLVFLLSPMLNLSLFNFIFEWLEALIRLVSGVFGKPVVFGQPDKTVLLVLLILLAILYDFKSRKKLVFLLSMLVSCLFLLTKFPAENEITMIDVGQGDSIFLRDMLDRTVLIDVGGKPNFGQKQDWQAKASKSNASRTLIPYLKSRGIGQIDCLVLTHTDTDHVGDLLELAKAVKIKQIYVSKGSLTQEDFVKDLAETGVTVKVVKQGDTIPIFDSQLEVLYPQKIGDGGNDDSIVLYGHLLKTSFLFTGDLEENGEKELLATYPNLTVDVLKAGHHGSKGSSSLAFLEQVQPKITLISAGTNNRYKHPHQETLERLEQVHTQIFRTDQAGAIRFKGWSSWKIETVR